MEVLVFLDGSQVVERLQLVVLDTVTDHHQLLHEEQQDGGDALRVRVDLRVREKLCHEVRVQLDLHDRRGVDPERRVEEVAVEQLLHQGLWTNGNNGVKRVRSAVKVRLENECMETTDLKGCKI